MNEFRKITTPENVVPAVAIIVLLIGALLGPIAMVVGSTVGLAICMYLFREQLRGRGWLTVAVSGLVAAVLAFAVAIAVSLA